MDFIRLSKQCLVQQLSSECFHCSGICDKNRHLLQMVYLMVSVLLPFCVSIQIINAPMASVNARVASVLSMDTV